MSFNKEQLKEVCENNMVFLKRNKRITMIKIHTDKNLQKYFWYRYSDSSSEMVKIRQDIDISTYNSIDQLLINTLAVSGRYLSWEELSKDELEDWFDTTRKRNKDMAQCTERLNSPAIKEASKIVSEMYLQSHSDMLKEQYCNIKKAIGHLNYFGEATSCQTNSLYKNPPLPPEKSKYLKEEFIPPRERKWDNHSSADYLEFLLKETRKVTTPSKSPLEQLKDELNTAFGQTVVLNTYEEDIKNYNKSLKVKAILWYINIKTYFKNKVRK